MTEKNMTEIGRRILLQQMDKESDEGSKKVTAKPASERTYEEAVDVTEREPETIQEILQAASSATATIATDLYNTFAGLSAESPDTTTSAWAYLTEGGKREATRDYRQQIADGARQQAVTRYGEATATLQERLAAREAFLKQQLFGTSQNPEVLARLATATDAEIKRASELASLTGNAELRAAVLAAASTRELGDILHETLTEEKRGYLNELAAVPGPEVRSRADDAEQVLPIPREDQIMPRADGTS